MKKLIVFLLVCSIFNAFSQTYTVLTSSVKMHIKQNQVTYQEAVAFPDQINPAEFTQTQHVLNLSDSTCSFYMFSVYINTVKIVKFQALDSTYEFTMLDYDVNGNDVYTYMIISKDFDMVYYYWYNVYQNATKVEIKTDFTVKFEN
jgi:hypothetical protein